MTATSPIAGDRPTMSTATLRNLDMLAVLLLSVVLIRIGYLTATWVLEVWTSIFVLVAALPIIGFARFFALTRLGPSSAALVYTAGLVLLSFAGATSSAALVFYTGRHLPMIDPMLQAADQWLGFDWMAYLGWFVRHDSIDPVFRFAYQSIFWQPVIVAIVLAWQHVDRLCAFIAAMVITLSIVSVLALFLPCLGPYAYLGVSTQAHPSMQLVTEAKHVGALLWLRDAAFSTAMPPSSAGLISFPSYHAAVAALCIWACWPIPGINAAMVLINVFMLTATPTHGSHYLVDILAGIAIAIPAAMLAVQLFRPADETPSSTAGT
jgi:hypothetical protein